MRATLTAIVCATALALWGCCAELDHLRATASLGPTPAAVKPAPIKPAPIKPAAAKPAAAEPSETERARASQAKQCAQRHIDRANGTLAETDEQKRMRDEICAAYYRGS
ncbi:MAG TPA: hypothetical protein VFA64_15965 [Hyphomicrobiaceae bacterium]|nr:hypothetical protein [Hyphomicrobiaceae bacterium]